VSCHGAAGGSLVTCASRAVGPLDNDDAGHDSADRRDLDLVQAGPNGIRARDRDESPSPRGEALLFAPARLSPDAASINTPTARPASTTVITAAMTLRLQLNHVLNMCTSKGIDDGQRASHLPTFQGTVTMTIRAPWANRHCL
jgi:hypothetical protein